MDIIGLADIDDHGLARVRLLKGHGLGLAQFGPSAILDGGRALPVP